MGYLAGASFSANGGQLVIVNQLAAGAFATSYEVKFNGRTALLKQYNDPTNTSHTPWYSNYLAYQDEIIGRVNSPAVVRHSVTILAVFEHKKKYHQIHEWVPNKTLREAISDGSVRRDRDLLQKALIGFVEGVAAVHKAGIVHTDLKPENALLVNGRIDDIRIIDFDWSLVVGKKLPWEGRERGTPGYFSYDWMKGRPVTHQSDIFTMGIILYEMITGRHPYDSAAPGPFNAHDDSQQKAYLPLIERGYYEDVEKHNGPIGGGPVNRMLAACLSKNPTDRPSLSDMLQVLKNAGKAGVLHLIHANKFSYTLTPDQSTNGQGWFGQEKCRMWPNYQFVSAYQADFLFDENAGCWIVDLPRDGSRPTNTTFINGKQVSGRVQLKGGELLQVGNPSTGNMVLDLTVEIKL